jgi:hypothetical protein
LTQYGFIADLTHLSVHGLCADCSQAGDEGEDADREVIEPAGRSHSHDTGDVRSGHTH